MRNSQLDKQLLKILIGVAWLDGIVQPEEREYLQQIAVQKGLADDPEIKLLLSPIKQVKPDECYSWLKAYLGNDLAQEKYQELNESINSLIESDEKVELQERKFVKAVQVKNKNQSWIGQNIKKRLTSIWQDKHFITNIFITKEKPSQAINSKAIDNSIKNKQLLKILIGVAWIDGLIQPEEQEYLQQIATQKGLIDDPEIKSLLARTKPIQPDECYDCLKTYLGSYPSTEDYQELSETLCTLIESDRNVDGEEEKFLKTLKDTSVVGGQNLLNRFLGVLLTNNFIPAKFPQLPKLTAEIKQASVVSQLLHSDFYSKLLVNAQGQPLLNEVDLSNLASTVRQIRFNPGQTIFRQGDPGETAYIVVSGIVKVQVEYQETSQIKQFAIGSGALFGETSLITGLPRISTTYAEQNVELLELSKQTFAQLVVLYPEIPDILANWAARQEEDASVLSRLKSVPSKNLAHTLSREKIVGRFQNIAQEVYGIYAHVPYTVINYLSTSASDKLVNNRLANIYLTDNFAPVKQEMTANDLPVIGELPKELSGMFLRIGPNPQFPPVGRHHWFDGDGMIHGVQINNGKAAYRNRYVRTKGFTIEQAEGRAIWPGLLNLPRLDLPQGMLFKNPANTAMVWHAHRLLALWDMGEPYEVEFPSLETVGSYTFDGGLTSAFTAHPKVDPVTGEMVFICMSPLMRPYLKYGVVSAEGKIVHNVSINLPNATIMHDFAITEHYTILVDIPVALQPGKLLRGESPIVFDAERPTRFGILPRYGDNSTVVWFTVPGFALFHTINAYEQGDEVLIFASRMDSTFFFVPHYNDGVLVDIDPAFESMQLVCWRLNIATGTVQEEVLEDYVPSDYPQINNSYLGRRMRYGYFARGDLDKLPKPLLNGLIKYDFENHSSVTHYYGQGRFGGEGVFAPRPNATAEDDGWLLTYVYDTELERSELLVIDAQDMTSDPVARVLLPQRVPYGFHALWVADTN
jgi:carotenoid cleavage dioxygenase